MNSEVHLAVRVFCVDVALNISNMLPIAFYAQLFLNSTCDCITVRSNRRVFSFVSRTVTPKNGKNIIQKQNFVSIAAKCNANVECNKAFKAK